MIVPDRPHCRKPDACAAKSASHCRGCIAARTQAEILADPERLARRMRLAAEAQRTPSCRAQQSALLKRQWQDPTFRAAAAENARQRAAAMVGNPEINRKRAESMRRTLSDPEVRKRRGDALRRALAHKMADKVGIPVELVPLYREIRDKVRATPEEAKAAVLASREAKNLARQTALAERVRSAGPMPAIGTPAHIKWSRRVNGIQSGEPRPC